MFDRQNPYFRAAMRNARLEAECREFAAKIQSQIDEELAKGAACPDALRDCESSESSRSSDRMRLELVLKRILEEAERHARMRKNMEPFLSD